jgi:VWFA-related protein
VRRFAPLIFVAAFALDVGAQQPTFRSGINLIEITVVVHDRSGKPVTNLTAGDFKVFEDGKEQKIEVFAVEADPSTPGSVQSFPLPANVFSNRAEKSTGGGVSVILLDRLNSTAEDMKRARDQVIALLANANPNDRIALYSLESDRVLVLHDFTSDMRRLIAILEKYRRNTSVAVAALEETAVPMPKIGIADFDADTAAWLERTQLILSDNLLAQRGRITLDALEGIANHLDGVQGRKNLIWVSASFPMVIPSYKAAPIILDKEVNRATRALNDADVAIYPVDVRGLIGAFSNVTTSTATVERNTRVGAAAPLPGNFTTLQTVSPAQDVMRALADATGGRVFLNTNALGDAVRRAMDDSRVSYVLGYYAPRPEPDSKVHEIKVTVATNGLDVRHRKSYLSLPPPAVTDSRTRLAALERVMMSPLTASGLALMAQLDRDSAGEAMLVIQINPESLTWMQKKDIREGAIDIVIAQSEPDGKYYKLKETTVNLTAEPDRYQEMLTEGFTLSSSVNLRPTAHRLHVVVSDVASRAIGSLIIPLSR